MVAYTLLTSGLRCTVDTLLDAASYGTCWVVPPVLSGSFWPCDPAPPLPCL